VVSLYWPRHSILIIANPNGQIHSMKPFLKSLALSIRDLIPPKLPEHSIMQSPSCIPKTFCLYIETRLFIWEDDSRKITHLRINTCDHIIVRSLLFCIFLLHLRHGRLSPPRVFWLWL
jgi:hypothetical protein